MLGVREPFHLKQGDSPTNQNCVYMERRDISPVNRVYPCVTTQTGNVRFGLQSE